LVLKYPTHLTSNNMKIHTDLWKVIRQLEFIFITEELGMPPYYFDPESKTMFSNVPMPTKEVRMAFLRWAIHTKMKVVVTLK
jgi:hypothetical protein